MQELDRRTRSIRCAGLVVAAGARHRMTQSRPHPGALWEYGCPHRRRQSRRTTRLAGKADRVIEGFFDPGRDVHASLPASTSMSSLIDI
jgi:hypothetical protein